MNRSLTLLTLALVLPLLSAQAQGAQPPALQAQAQPGAQTRLTLPGAVARALAAGADVSSARATLQKAQAALRAARADPTSLITTLTQAEQEVTGQTAALDAAKLSTLQATLNSYLAASETAGRISLNAAQVALDERNLAIARARLASRVATALEVSRAQNSLNSNRQELADARAQLPVQLASLARVLGLPAGTPLSLAAPPAPPRLTATVAGLQSGLERRLPALVQAAGGAAFARLQVRLASNDYTPARTLQDAQVTLANAERSLQDAQAASATAVRDAYRAVQDAQARVTLAREQAANAQTALTQAQARLKAGTAAAVEVQQAQVQAQQAALGVTQAQNGVWRALAALSVASGVDVTGLVK
ncbi:TolC family protein [Deinococcus hohokamensis]|uniref:TolC family protein n=1 Tax=Deinococcus hohokamensis TaxID=309883 RepID=A0ABV9I7Z8_9DEIO